jgi:hypothetical protein
VKLEALDHPKTIALAAELGIKMPQTIGHLELLWAFVAKKTPAGDIGKWPDAVIAHSAQWDGDPGALIAALLAVRLLEPHSTHRLIVHDWAEHMPNWVRAKLKKTNGEVVSTDLSSDLSSDLRGYYKGREGKGREEKRKGASFIVPDWIPKTLWDDWMKIRARKKAINSDIAKAALITNLEKIRDSGISPEVAIKTAIEKSWKSCELDWLKNTGFHDQTEPPRRSSRPL